MNIHFKKNLIFLLYLLYNALLVFVFFYLEYGILYTSILLFASHLRDFFCVIYGIIRLASIGHKKPQLSEDIKRTICCLIPVYAEKAELVLNNLKSLCEQDLPENTKLILMIICDGLIVGKHNEKPLFNELDDVLTYEDNTKYEERYIGWKTKSPNSLVYKIGEIYGNPIILSHKIVNGGKKDSLISGEQLIEKIHTMEPLKKYNLKKPEFIYHTDSDTVADKMCLRNLLETFQENENIDGVSGMVRAYYNQDTYEQTDWTEYYEKAMYIMQDFQYYYSLTLKRMTESEMETTVCLPGCVNMIKINEKSQRAIKDYAKLPKKETNFLQAVTRMQGTDRRYTTLLLRHGAKLQMNWRAVVYTEPPLNVKGFINQRRRWASNAFFNSFIILFLPDIPIYVRISSLIDINRLYTTIYRLISVFFFWMYVKEFNLIENIILFVILILPYAYVLTWAYNTIPEWRRMILGMILNKVIMPFLSFITITKMYLTASNFAWGGLVQPDSSSKSISTIEEVEDALEMEIVECDIISEEEIILDPNEAIEVVIR